MPGKEYPSWVHQLDENASKHASAALVQFERHMSERLKHIEGSLEEGYQVCLEEELNAALEAAALFFESLSCVPAWIAQQEWQHVSHWFNQYSRQRFYFQEALPFYLRAASNKADSTE